MHSESSETFKIKLFAKKIEAIFAKSSILHVCLGSECATEALSLHKNEISY